MIRDDFLLIPDKVKMVLESMKWYDINSLTIDKYDINKQTKSVYQILRNIFTS